MKSIDAAISRDAAQIMHYVAYSGVLYLPALLRVIPQK